MARPPSCPGLKVITSAFTFRKPPGPGGPAERSAERRSRAAWRSSQPHLVGIEDLDPPLLVFFGRQVEGLPLADRDQGRARRRERRLRRRRCRCRPRPAWACPPGCPRASARWRRPPSLSRRCRRPRSIRGQWRRSATDLALAQRPARRQEAAVGARGRRGGRLIGRRRRRLGGGLARVAGRLGRVGGRTGVAAPGSASSGASVTISVAASSGAVGGAFRRPRAWARWPCVRPPRARLRPRAAAVARPAARRVGALRAGGLGGTWSRAAAGWGGRRRRVGHRPGAPAVAAARAHPRGRSGAAAAGGAGTDAGGVSGAARGPAAHLRRRRGRRGRGTGVADGRPARCASAPRTRPRTDETSATSGGGRSSGVNAPPSTISRSACPAAETTSPVSTGPLPSAPPKRGSARVRHQPDPVKPPAFSAPMTCTTRA